MNGMTLATYYHDTFRPGLPKLMANVTKRKYDLYVENFLEFAGSTITVADVTAERLGWFRDWLQQRKQLGIVTAENRASFIRRVAANATPRPRRRKRRKSLLRMVRASRIDRAPAGTVEHFFRTSFAPSVLAECSDRTRNQYATAVNRLADFTGGYTRLTDFSREQIECFREWSVAQCGNNVTPGKYARHLRRILATYRPELPKPQHHASKIIDSEAPEGSVRWFVESRYLAERIVCDKYRASLPSRLRAFGQSLGREPMLSDLNAVAINQHLKALLAGGRSPWTVQGHKATLRALWQAAYDWSLLDVPPGRLLRIPKPPLNPQAWREDEYRRLLAACDDPWFDRLRGGVVPLGRFLRAAIMLAYDTGVRLGDLLAADWRSLNDDGTLMVTMSKTGFLLPCPVAPETVEALRAIRQTGDSRLLPWPVHPRKLWRDHKRLRMVAGLPTGRGHAFQKLRRTSITMVEADQPGAGPQHAGHRNPAVTNRHYIDQAVARRPRLPPRIAAAGRTHNHAAVSCHANCEAS